MHLLRMKSLQRASHCNALSFKYFAFTRHLTVSGYVKPPYLPLLSLETIHREKICLLQSGQKSLDARARVNERVPS